MIICLYRWKLKPGFESQFQEAWSYVTKELRTSGGSLGSRLHVGNDGLYYGYSQWPSCEVRENSHLTNPEIDTARNKMREAIEETLPEIILDPQIDFLVSSDSQPITKPHVKVQSISVYDHISVGVKNLERAATFYDASLSALGYVRLFKNERAVSYGPVGFKGEAPFTIIQHGADARCPGAGFHLSFVAANREAVNQFHAAALSAGGIDEGAPGIRENYDPGYYAAFVRDPDGHRIEAVIHEKIALSRNRCQ